MNRIPVATLLLLAGTTTSLSSCAGESDAEKHIRLVFEQAVASATRTVALEPADQVDTVTLSSADAIRVLGKVDGADGSWFEAIADIEVDTTTGEIYVADVGRREILVYGQDSEPLRGSVGRPGTGPGEFREPREIFVLEDTTLGVWDPALERVTLFGPHGEVRTFRLSSGQATEPVSLPLARTARQLRPIADGYLLEARAHPLRVTAGEQLGALVYLDRHLRLRDTALSFRVPQIAASYSTAAGGHVSRYDEPPIFSPAASWAVSSDGFVAFAAGGAYEIVIFSLSLVDLPVLLRWSLPPERVSRRDRLRRLKHEAAKPRSGIPGAFPVAALEPLVRYKFSPYRPAITGLMWDGPARLWVRRFDTRFDPEGPGGNWHVIAWGGPHRAVPRVVSVVRFTDRIVPLTATRDRIYGFQTDSLGVQRVIVVRHPWRAR